MDSSYNDSFGSFGSGSDVVLASENKRRLPWKWVVVVGCIVLTALCIVIAVVFNKNNPTFDSAHKYAHYVLTGDENNSDVGEGFQEGEVYYFEKMLYSEEKRDWDVFYNKAKELLDEVMVDVSQDENELFLERSSRDLLEIYNLSKSMDDDISTVFLNECVDQGEQSLTEYINASTGAMSNAEENYVVMYRNDLIKLGEKIKEYVKTYREADCLSESVEELLTCELDDSQEEKTRMLWDEVFIIEVNVRDILTTSMEQFAKNAYGLIGYYKGDMDVEQE